MTIKKPKTLIQIFIIMTLNTIYTKYILLKLKKLHNFIQMMHLPVIKEQMFITIFMNTKKQS
jgi:hypothetical protein